MSFINAQLRKTVKVQDREFDNIFRKAARNVREEPSKSVWSAIERDLDSSRPYRILNYVSALRWVASVALLVAFAFGVIFNYDDVADDLIENRAEKVVAEKSSDSEQQKEVKSQGVNQLANNYKTEFEKNDISEAQIHNDQSQTKSQPLSKIAERRAEKPADNGSDRELVKANTKEQDQPIEISSDAHHELTKMDMLRAEIGSEYVDAGELSENSTLYTFDELPQIASKLNLRVGVFAGMSLQNPNVIDFAEFNYYNFSNEVADYRSMDKLESSKSVTSAFDFGAQAILDIGNHFSVVSGVEYTKFSGNQRYYYDVEEQVSITVKRMIPLPAGPPIPDGQFQNHFVEQEQIISNRVRDTLFLNYQMRSVNVPLEVRYRTKMNRFEIYGSVGAAVDIYQSRDIQYNSSQINIEEKESRASRNYLTNMRLNAGVGIGYSITESIMFYSEPRFSHFTNLNEDSPFENNTQRYSVRAGLIFNL